MIELFNKKLNLLHALYVFTMILGILIVSLQAYYYFKFNAPFFDKITLIGLGNFCLGFYSLFIKRPA